LDLDINYNYTEKIGFSIKAHNVLNVTTPFWNGYEEMGINYSLGLNYIF
jgi:outer membrane receptor protein involved in Fe transport